MVVHVALAEAHEHVDPEESVDHQRGGVGVASVQPGCVGQKVSAPTMNFRAKSRFFAELCS